MKTEPKGNSGPEPGRCACGCNQPLTGHRPTARYATNACRTRAWKQRTGYTDQRARKPSRNANPAPARPRIDYLRAVRAVASLADTTTAHQALDPLLTSRGRAGATFHTRQHQTNDASRTRPAPIGGEHETPRAA